MDTVLEYPTEYACISALRKGSIVQYEEDYSLFLLHLKPESLKFKSFRRTLYFNCLKIVMGCDVLGNERVDESVFPVAFSCVLVHLAVGLLRFGCGEVMPVL